MNKYRIIYNTHVHENHSRLGAFLKAKSQDGAGIKLSAHRSRFINKICVHVYLQYMVMLPSHQKNSGDGETLGYIFMCITM